MSTGKYDAHLDTHDCEHFCLVIFKPSIGQWKTVLSVTKAMVFTLIHFQKITSSLATCALILLFISKLKICRVFPAEDRCFVTVYFIS